MAKHHQAIIDTRDRELVFNRVLNAPRELVFKVWTDPKHVVNWWGPDGFTSTVHEMRVKPGGVWRFTMHGPDGTNYPNKIVFIEVVKPELLVYTQGSDIPDLKDDPYHFHVTITFAAEGKKTNLTMRGLFLSVAALEERKKAGAVEGGKQSLNRLEEYLAVTDV